MIHKRKKNIVLEIFKKRWKQLFVIVVLGVIIFSPYAIGYLVQSTVEKDLQIFFGGNSTVKLVSYQRGIFKSTAVLKISNQQDALNVNVNIFHGPYLFLYQGGSLDSTYFGLAKASYKITALAATQEKLVKYFGNQELLTGQVTLGFDGLAVVRYRSAVMTYFNNEQNFVYNWPGFSGTVTLIPKAHLISNHVAISDTKITTAYGSLKISGGKIVSMAQQSADGIWLETVNIDIDNAQAISKDVPYLIIDKLHFEIQTNQTTDHMLEYRDRLNVGALTINGVEYVPSYTTTTIKPMAIPAYKQFIFELNKAIQKPMTDSSNELIDFLATILPLINNGAKLNKYVEISTPSGKITANFDLYQDTAGTPVTSLQQLRGTLRLAMPQEVLAAIITTAFSNSTDQMKKFKQQHQDIIQGVTPNAQMQRFLANQISQGYITVDGSNYTMDFTLQDGEYRLNGKPIDISFLLPSSTAVTASASK